MPKKIDKEFAAELMRACLSISEPFNNLTLITDELDEGQRRRFRHELGEIYGTIYGRIMIPIIREYPDLDPDGPWLPSDENQNGEA